MTKNRGICAAHTCIPQYREYPPPGTLVAGGHLSRFECKYFMHKIVSSRFLFDLMVATQFRTHAPYKIQPLYL